MTRRKEPDEERVLPEPGLSFELGLTIRIPKTMRASSGISLYGFQRYDRDTIVIPDEALAEAAVFFTDIARQITTLAAQRAMLHS